jgi:UDP-N-acetylglucosamine--N-acetylmuramyl-(pentapeptide) pyrophosphoryl-undecaprenol N-acetylglucosamine transferase
VDTGRIRETGNPIRPEAVALARAPYEMPSADGPIRLLVFGGSQGARALSELVPAAAAMLPEDMRSRIEVVQQARPEDVDSVRAAYAAAGIGAEVAPFFRDLPQQMARAELVICRSGASTVSELAVIGRPAILIPYPFATDDHQTANATVLEQAGAAWLIQQRDLTAEKLSELLADIFREPDQLARRAQAAASLGKPDAAARLADVIDEIGGPAA